MIKNLSPTAVKEILDSSEKVRLIDVREEWEYEIANINNAELLPLSNFMNHFNKLNPDDKIIVYCHHGARSFQVCSYLVQNGFSDVANLDGGINAWAEEVDNSVPQY